MDAKELKDLCYEDMYPPRFDILVSGKRESPEVRATFKFTGIKRELQSQVLLECCTGKIAAVCKVLVY